MSAAGPVPVGLHLPDAEAQGAFGGLLSALLPPRLVVYLRGDLGTGKTTLVRGLLRGLGHRGAVRSPTYTLVEPYELDALRVYHLDLYRLGDPEELEYLGLRDIAGEAAVMLVEWPERGAGALPPADLEIRIHHARAGRRLELSPGSPAGAAVLAGLRGAPGAAAFPWSGPV